MKKYIISLLLLYCFELFAQDIEVKKFELLEKDQTAVTSPRKDINGTACGLVKVALKEPGAEFEGNVMGDVQFTGSEYFVYMPNGSKRLGIKHPDYLPTTIVFADYGTKRVASSTTYELKVKANKKKAKVDDSKKGMAVFNIKPSNAMLLIDGQIADGSGGAYTLTLPYGTHYYTVKLNDFSINNQMLTISHDINTVDVDLTEYFSWIKISSETKESKVLINGEFLSNDSWEGVLPPSKYLIELVKDGYRNLSKTIELYECDSIICSFPKMEVIGGGLKFNYKPDSCEVYLDGKFIGKQPFVYDGVPEGSHKVEIKCENYETVTRDIKMLADQTLLIEGKLELTDLGYLITRASEGDLQCQWRLGNIYLGSDHGAFDREDLPSKPSHPCPRIEQDLEKAVFWLEKAAAGKYDVKHDFYDYPRWAKESLSECYILKREFQKSFYWAEKSKDKLLMALLYYSGLGVPKDKQKCSQLLLGLEWYLKRLDVDKEQLLQCEEGNIDDFFLKETIDKIIEFEGKQEIWNILTKSE